MIFLDSTGRRWRVFRFALFILTAFTLAVTGFFLAGLFVRPQFPSPYVRTTDLYLQTERHEHTGVPGTLVKLPFHESEPALEPENVLVQPVMYQRSGPPLVFGFHVAWDENSFKSLKANYHSLTHVLAEWLVVENDKGNVRDLTQPEVVDWARTVNLPILAVLTNYRDDGWQSKDLDTILSNRLLRRRLIENVVSVVRKYKLAGVNLDLEQIPARDRRNLTAFVSDMHKALGEAGLLLTQDLPTDDADARAYDFTALGALNDYVIPMVYDEHYSSGAPGPVASRGWVRDQLQQLLHLLPREKTVVGLGNYGYDWTLGSTRSAVEVTFADVFSLADELGGKVQWNRGSSNPSLQYSKGDSKHEIWFLDAVTALNSVCEVHRNGLAGVAFWRLGAEDPYLWRLFEGHRWPNKQLDAGTLENLPAIEEVRQYGRGEAIRITSTRGPGRRRVWSDGTALQEEFIKNPTADVVGGIGASDDKLVSLTFDDGPDPQYTPAILDILKAKHVPATFFVVGDNARRNEALLRRMYAEGHNIGNHTFSHLREITSTRRLEVELGLTQRVIEDATDHSTTLFRSPYNADSDPRTLSAVASVLGPQKLGYVTVGERIDPRDWEAKNPNEIVSAVLRDRQLGSIILLHDGGGNRESTIKALPVLIDALQNRGDRFVSLQTLIGFQRQDLMPPAHADERFWATLEGGALAGIGKAVAVVRFLFLFAIGLTVLRSLAYTILGIRQKRLTRKHCFNRSFQPPVSVIIAAFNEEKVIAGAVRAVLASEYPEFEVLIMDDGSSDSTLEVLRTEFADDQRVRIYTQPNSGKSVALNRLLREAKHGVVVALDADTLFLPDTLSKLVRHFADPRVAAVSGNARVGNKTRWLGWLQSLEYVCSFNLDRRALDLLNAITVVPGAVGAWRKQAVLDAGGYPHDTVAEDADLTLALRRRGHIIRYEDQALAYTEVPETMSQLVRQRLRWNFGTLQAAWKHSDAMLRAQYGTMGLIALPSIWLFQIVLATLSPFAEMALLIGITTGHTPSLLIYYGALLLWELATSCLAYALENESFVEVLFVPLQRIVYPQLMVYVVCKSTILAIAGRGLSWGKQTRTANARIGCRVFEPQCVEMR